MRDFITCLEFLTRIRFSHRTDWRDEDFSRSVPYFPLVGLVIGAFLGAVNYALVMVAAPDFMRAAVLILAEIIITGGLMYGYFRRRFFGAQPRAHAGNYEGQPCWLQRRTGCNSAYFTESIGVPCHLPTALDAGADCHERCNAYFYGNFYRQLSLRAQNRHRAYVYHVR